MVKEGKSLATITMAGFGQSEQKGTDFLEVEFKTKDTEDLISWRGYFTDKTIEFRKRDLETLGFQGSLEDLDTLTEKNLDCTKEYEIDVEHETTEKGNTYPKVKWINTPRAKVETKAGLSSRLKGMGLTLSTGQKVTTSKVSSDKKVVKCETIEEASALLDKLPF